MLKCFSESCERNKDPILRVLKDVLKDCSEVLEVGSGSGQHALYFSEQLPHLHWRPTELSDNLEALSDNLKLKPRSNLSLPVELDVEVEPWPVAEAQNVFTANTLHIMPLVHVEHFFRGAGTALSVNGFLCVYGPFRYGNKYTSESNEKFDGWLKVRDERSGIRDFEALHVYANKFHLKFVRDYNMPANNQLLVWKKFKELGD